MGVESASRGQVETDVGLGCEEGKELRRVWRRIKEEVTLCCDYLGEELPMVMATNTMGGIGDRGH